MDVSWWTFLGVVLLAYVVPGPDLVVILRASTQGWRRGVAAAVGAQCGLLVHMVLAVVGLSLVLSRHPEALTAIRVVGGLYLLYLGGRLVVSTFGDAAAVPATGATSFRDGLLTNLTNPKAILFFAAVLPQFVAPGPVPVAVQVAVLGTVDVLVGFVPWAAVVLVGHRLQAALARDRVRRWWDRVTGTAIGGLGGTLVARG